MGIWREYFSWQVLSKWDLLGAIIPGFPIAIGLGMLTVDWFPHNLLISQICFGAAGAILCAKFVAVAIQAEDQHILSRIVFAVLVCAVLLGSTAVVIAIIQEHKTKAEDKEDRERSALFESINEFISTKDENELRETFDLPTITRDAILEAKEQLTPAAIRQVEKDTLARDMVDGQNVFYYRYVHMETNKDGNHITPIPGKSGVLHLPYKAVQARKKLTTLYSSALIPAEVAQTLKDFEKALVDDQEILMDTINESYATKPTSIANAFDCPKEECSTVNNLFYSRFIQLQPKAEAVTNAMRKYHEAVRE
jgi:hypothetical protein